MKLNEKIVTNISNVFKDLIYKKIAVNLFPSGTLCFSYELWLYTLGMKITDFICPSCVHSKSHLYFPQLVFQVIEPLILNVTQI